MSKAVKLIAALMILLGIASLGSAFCYGAFGYTWWRPIDDFEFGRALILVISHVVGIVAGFFGAEDLWK